MLVMLLVLVMLLAMLLVMLLLLLLWLTDCGNSCVNAWHEINRVFIVPTAIGFNVAHEN